jgi:hypothetical protein
MAKVISETPTSHPTLGKVVHEAIKSSVHLYFLPIVFAFRIANQVCQWILKKAQPQISSSSQVQAQVITLERSINLVLEVIRDVQLNVPLKQTIWEEWMQEYTQEETQVLMQVRELKLALEKTRAPKLVFSARERRKAGTQVQERAQVLAKTLKRMQEHLLQNPLLLETEGLRDYERRELKGQSERLIIVLPYLKEAEASARLISVT